MTDVFLLFSMQFDRDPGLDQGRLSLNLLPDATVPIKPNIWLATSSTAGKQSAERFNEKGGLIPPQYRVPGLNNYFVLTTPIPMPNIKGVNGNFYKINPHQVKTDKGVVRGDFGIHKDANVPGSLGCIVLSSERFANFESEMKTLARLGVIKIPLWVQYS